MNLIHQAGIVHKKRKHKNTAKPFSVRRIFRLLKLKQALALCLAFSFFTLPEFPAPVLQASADTLPVSANAYSGEHDPAWVETDIKYGELKKEFDDDSFAKNYITFSEFVKKNTSTNGFYLHSDFRTDKSYDKGFDPESCIIVLETGRDLYDWSRKQYYSGGGVLQTQVNKEEHLVYMMAHYVLGNNINYNEANGITPIGLYGIFGDQWGFRGSFDGQGFEISNLKLSNLDVDYKLTNPDNAGEQKNMEYLSMFAWVSAGAAVENLGLRSPSYSDDIINSTVIPGFKCAGIAGYNAGTVQYCFVLSGTARHSFRSGSDATAAGVVHTNATGGNVNNVYYAGGITGGGAAGYSAVIYVNNGTANTEIYYDSSVIGSGVVYTAAVGKSTSQLQNRTNILGITDDLNSRWYTDSYASAFGYPTGYPRLQGFKTRSEYSRCLWLLRPADLIFFANTLDEYSTFGDSASATRYSYRLYRCLNMGGVASGAYVTPKNDFAGYWSSSVSEFTSIFEGTVGTAAGETDPGCPCRTAGEAHPGTGDQRSNHCIIDLRITTPSVTENYINLGMTKNEGTTSTVSAFRNINFVGGGITVPKLQSNDVRQRTLCVGMLSANSNYIYMQNVHSSADILVGGGTDSYMGRACIGGLVGGTAFDAATGTSYTYFDNCSNSGEVAAGNHVFAPDTAPVNSTAGVGGIIGMVLPVISGTQTRMLIKACTNFGDITGVGLRRGTDGVVNTGFTHVGGVVGYWHDNYVSRYRTTVTSLVNRGQIYSMAEAGDSLPVNAYYIGGVFGVAPMLGSDTSEAHIENRLYNTGDIFARAIQDFPQEYVPAINELPPTVYVSGIAGTSYDEEGSDSGRGDYYTNAVNTGNLCLDKELPSVFAAGLFARAIQQTKFQRFKGQTNLSNCQNYGEFRSIDGGPLVLSPKYRSYIAGVVVGHGGGTIYNSNNYADINVDFVDSPAIHLVVGGVSVWANPNNCTNYGDVNIGANTITGNLYVAGVAAAALSDYFNGLPVQSRGSDPDGTEAYRTDGTQQYASNCTNTVNLGAVTVSTTDHTEQPTVGDVYIYNSENGTRYDPNGSNESAHPYGRLFVAGIAVSTGSLNGCINGSKDDPDAGKITVTTEGHVGNPFISGIGAANNWSSFNDCINYGDISLERIVSTPYYQGETKTPVGYTANIYGIFRGTTGGGYSARLANYGDIIYDCYFADSVSPGDYKYYGLNANIAGIGRSMYELKSSANYGNIVLGSKKDLYFFELIVSGVIGEVHNVRFLEDCINEGSIGNGDGMAVTSCATEDQINYTDSSLTVSGIAYKVPVYTERCVNRGNIDITVRNAPDTQKCNYFLSGIAYQSESYASQTDFGIKNLTNTGNITFLHNETAIPASSKVSIGGIFNYAGTGRNATLLPFRNLINSGDITVDVDTNRYYYADWAIADYMIHLRIGGVFANMSVRMWDSMPAYLDISDCANVGNITAVMSESITSAVDATHYYRYAIGGIMGASVSNEHADNGYFTAYNRQLAQIRNSVNGGNITVTANKDHAGSVDCGVGGIVGYSVQAKKGSVTGYEEQLKSGIYSCINFGTISGGMATGGILGMDGTVVKDVINFGTVISEGIGAGGIVGAINFKGAGYSDFINDTGYVLENAVNYGHVEGGGNTKVGGIIGSINTDWANPSGAYRSFKNLINATDAETSTGENHTASVKMIGNAMPGAVSALNLVDVCASGYNWNDGYGTFNTATAKTVGPVTEENSIYYTAFPLRTSAFEAQSMVRYITPENSARNRKSGEKYIPYEFGVYGVMTTTASIHPADFPSKNIDVGVVDTVTQKTTNPTINGVEYSEWNDEVLDKLANCMQINEYHNYNIVQLAVTDDPNGTGQHPLSMKSLPVTFTQSDETGAVKTYGYDADGTPREVQYTDYTNLVPELSFVHFYVTRDSFNGKPLGEYTLDRESKNTILGRGAEFVEDDIVFDLAAKWGSLDDPRAKTPAVFEYYVTAQCNERLSAGDPNDHYGKWTIIFHYIDVEYPLYLTRVRESQHSDRFVNSSSGGYLHGITDTDKSNNTIGKYFPDGSTAEDKESLNLYPGKEGETITHKNGFTIKEDIRDIHNNTLILNISTLGLIADINREGQVRLEGEGWSTDGKPGMGGAADWGTVPNSSSASGKSYNDGVYYNNNFYFKLLDSLMTSKNYHVRDDRYAPGLPEITTPTPYQHDRDYHGEITINLQLHSNLPSGNYRIAFEIASYNQTYYFYFTREKSSQCEITYKDNIARQIEAYITNENGEGGRETVVLGKVDAENALITNNFVLESNQVYYGEAPDLQRLNEELKSILATELSLSRGAEILGDMRLVGITDTPADQLPVGSGKGSKTYTFEFTVQAEDGTVKDWRIEIVTQPAKSDPTTIAAQHGNGNGQTWYYKNDFSNEGVILDHLSLDYGSRGSWVENEDVFTVRHYLDPSMTGDNRLYNINNEDYYRYELYYTYVDESGGHKVLITEDNAADYGLRIINNGIITEEAGEKRTYLEITIDPVTYKDNIKPGECELKVFYTRGESVEIDPPVEDKAGQYISEITWEDIEYTPFVFYIASGDKFCYALAIDTVQPSLAATFVSDSKSLRIEQKSTGWKTLLYEEPYLTELEAPTTAHHTFYIDISFDNERFYRSYAPKFTLQTGATLWRLENGTYVPVISGSENNNEKTNFLVDGGIRYRVYAADMRFYQDYVVRLAQVARIKKFNITFRYEGEISPVPVGAIFRSVAPTADIENDYSVNGMVSVFRDVDTSDINTTDNKRNHYQPEWLPAGRYVVSLDVPYGYEAELKTNGDVVTNTFTHNNIKIAGETAFFVTSEARSEFQITVVIRKIPNFVPPWGIRTDSLTNINFG